MTQIGEVELDSRCLVCLCKTNLARGVGKTGLFHLLVYDFFLSISFSYFFFASFIHSCRSFSTSGFVTGVYRYKRPKRGDISGISTRDEEEIRGGQRTHTSGYAFHGPGYMGHGLYGGMSWYCFSCLFHFGRIIEIGLEKGKSGQAAFSFLFSVFLV